MFGTQTAGNRDENRATNKIHSCSGPDVVERKSSMTNIQVYIDTVKAAGQYLRAMETFVPQKIVQKSRLDFKRYTQNKQNLWIIQISDTESTTQQVD